MAAPLRPVWPGAPRYGPDEPWPAYRYRPGIDPRPREHDVERTPREHFFRGIDLYHQGYLWEAHEAWEAFWKPHLVPVEREFCRALIQLAAALLKRALGNPAGEAKLRARVAARLDASPSMCLSLDTAAVAASEAPRLVPQPLPEFATERLRLRAVRESDLEELVAMDGDADVLRFIHPPKPEEESRRRWAAYVAAPPHLPPFGLWVLDRDGAFLGWAILKALPGHGDIEVGYRLKQEAWGKGYATEAARRLVRHGFETCGLKEIVAITHPENAASQRVLRKCGLREAGERDFEGQKVLFFRGVE